MDTGNEWYQFTLRLPEDLAKALREQAQAHERSQGGEVRHILRAHLVHEQTVGAFIDTMDLSEGDQP